MARAAPVAAPVAAPAAMPVQGRAREALFAAVRAARVGGRFWAAPARLAHPPQIVLRPRAKADLPAFAAQAQGRWAVWVVRESGKGDLLGKLPAEWLADGDPWSVLAGAGELLAHGDDEWIALAHLLGVPVTIVSPGLFGVPDDDAATLADRTAGALSQPVFDPFGRGWLAPERALDLLADWRRVLDGNRGPDGQPIVAVCGMAWWKRAEIRRFLWAPGNALRMERSPRRALAQASAKGGALAVWPSRVTPALLTQARALGVPLVRVEDGFVRSAGLGSDLVPPSSIVVDWKGIHFDPAGPSDLEVILGNTRFTPALLDRARRLADTIVSGRISKYTATGGAGAPPWSRAKPDRPLVLVPGQVEDDLSVLAGGGGISPNLELLRRVRELEPEAEIWWRPHPDVDAGHRTGAVPDAAALAHADRIVRGGSMAALLDMVDAVHVLTSLTGFEALLRGCAVTCHGTPFYAGWGLTRDLGPVPGRRGRALSLPELVAGVLILYPRYLDPQTGLPCPPEVLVERMAHNGMVNRQKWIGPLRRLQGRIMAGLRKRAPLLRRGRP